MKKTSNYIDMEQVINKYWIDSKDMNTLLPQLTKNANSKEFKKIVDEMKVNDELYFETRPILIPVEKVIDKFRINKNLIRKEAKQMKLLGGERVEIKTMG